MNVLRYGLKAVKYEKQKHISRISPLNGGDDMFDTKTLNLADVSSFSPCVINFNLLLCIVESGSTLSNKFWLCCSFIKVTTCHA